MHDAPLIITHCQHNSELNSFVELPFQLYTDDPNWIPPLKADLRNQLSRKANPYFLHSDAAFFIAKKGPDVVGRIAAFHNQIHIKTHHDNTGFFGLFECINDQGCANALIEAAANWLRTKGLSRLLGPIDFSLNDECGLLIDGFDTPPNIKMNHHHPYYKTLFDESGLEKEIDLLSYELDWTQSNGLNGLIQSASKKLSRSPHIDIRPFNPKNLKNDIDVFVSIYNQTLAQNWGAIPLDASLVLTEFQRIKDLILPELILGAYVDNTPVGVLLALPNLSPIFKKINGSLWPFGWRHFLNPHKHVNGARIVFLGVLDTHQHLGITHLLLSKCYEAMQSKPYTHVEMSWILENNAEMNGVMKGLNKRIPVHINKRYRVYRSSL